MLCCVGRSEVLCGVVWGSERGCGVYKHEARREKSGRLEAKHSGPSRREGRQGPDKLPHHVGCRACLLSM